MRGFRFAELLQAAREDRTGVLGELNLGEAKFWVNEWLNHIKRALDRIDPPDRDAAALTVLERSFNGVLTAVQPTPPPPRDEAGFRQRLNPLTRNSKPPPEPAPVQVNGQSLLLQLQYTAEAVDRLLDHAVAPEPIRETLPWADDQVLLAQLWPLLGALATANGDAALVQLRQLEQTLRLHHDIEMRLADHTATGESFDLYPGEGDDYVTVTPALFVRGKLWKRGEARRPRAVDVTAGGPRTAPDRGPNT